MGHITGLVHKGFASIDNLGLVPRVRTLITIVKLLLISMFTVFVAHIMNLTRSMMMVLSIMIITR